MYWQQAVMCNNSCATKQQGLGKERPYSFHVTVRYSRNAIICLLTIKNSLGITSWMIDGCSSFFIIVVASMYKTSSILLLVDHRLPLPFRTPDLVQKHHLLIYARGYEVSGNASRCSRWCSLACGLVSLLSSENIQFLCPSNILDVRTYVWQTAVSAWGDLGLVGVDKDSGVSSRATAAVACDNLVVCPPNRLPVNEFNGGLRLRLCAC